MGFLVLKTFKQSLNLVVAPAFIIIIIFNSKYFEIAHTGLFCFVKINNINYLKHAIC